MAVEGPVDVDTAHQGLQTTVDSFLQVSQVAQRQQGKIVFFP